MTDQMWRVSGSPLDRLFRDVAVNAPGCLDAVISGSDVLVRCKRGSEVAETLPRIALAAGVTLAAVREVPPTMEDVFMSLMGGHAG